MLISPPAESWSLYEHTTGELEVSLVGVHSSSIGGRRVVGIELVTPGGERLGIRLAEEEARRLLLHLRNTNHFLEDRP